MKYLISVTSNRAYSTMKPDVRSWNLWHPGYSVPAREQAINFHLFLARVESVSVRFRSKEQGTRVKDRAKNGASKRAGQGWGRKLRKHPPPPRSFIFWLSFHFPRGQNRKSRSSVFLCSETKRKRVLRRL